MLKSENNKSLISHQGRSINEREYSEKFNTLLIVLLVAIIAIVFIDKYLLSGALSF